MLNSLCSSDISKKEYLREANYNDQLDIPNDVKIEQQKVNRCDVIIFIYPVFWSEAPLILVGWFQRVWTYGYAYGAHSMKKLDKALFLVTMGGSLKDEIRKRQVQAMKEIMLNDRISTRAKKKEMIVFDRMSREYDQYHFNKIKFLNQIQDIINHLWSISLI